MNGLTEAKAALKELRQFIGKSQRAAFRDLFRGEERQHFFDKAACYPRAIAGSPRERIRMRVRCMARRKTEDEPEIDVDAVQPVKWKPRRR